MSEQEKPPVEPAKSSKQQLTEYLQEMKKMMQDLSDFAEYIVGETVFPKVSGYEQILLHSKQLQESSASEDMIEKTLLDDLEQLKQRTITAEEVPMNRVARLQDIMQSLIQFRAESIRLKQVSAVLAGRCGDMLALLKDLTDPSVPTPPQETYPNYVT